MKFDENHIIKYIRGELPEEEKNRIEALREVDEELRREIDFHRSLMYGIESQLKSQVKAQLQAEEAQIHNTSARGEPGNAKRRPPRIPQQALAAAVAVLIAIVGGSVWWFQQSSPGSVAAKHFEPYPNHITQHYRGANENDKNPVLIKAMNSYSAKEYEQAMGHLESLINQRGGSALTHFYLANSYLAEKQTKEAIEHFEKAEDKGLPEDFQLPNQWFKALAHLQSGEKAKARKMLNRLQQAPSDFYQKAVRDLKKDL